MRRKGRTIKELLTWKWDLLSPWFLAGMEEWGRMQTCSELNLADKRSRNKRQVVYQCHVLA